MYQFEARNAKGDALHEALRSVVSVPTRVWLWTEAHAFTFTPELSDTVFGDGKALFTITTINDRPRYWVIRCDSTWASCEGGAPDDAPEFIDLVDEIKEAMEEEFGLGRPDDNAILGKDDRYRDMDTGQFCRGKQPYPAFDDRDGCSWGRMRWPDIDGFKFVKHPWAYCNIPAEEVHA